LPDEIIKVLLVDDHPVVRVGLERILEQCPDITVVGAAETGREALEMVGPLAPDVVLLDLSLPDVHGLDIIQDLTAQGQGASKVLVLTVHDDGDMAIKAVRAGAKGYVLKSSSGDELLAAIRRIAHGGEYFDAVVVHALMREGARHRDPSSLSERELEVLRLVASGLTNKEVAARLYLSVETVKAHLETIYRKLGAGDRTHAVAVALREGLLE
jgi:two-component system, NarL family, response regulator